MADIRQLRDGQHFALEAEVHDRIKKLIAEYEGRLSLVAAMGILELVKMEIKEAA